MYQRNLELRKKYLKLTILVKFHIGVNIKSVDVTNINNMFFFPSHSNKHKVIETTGEVFILYWLYENNLRKMVAECDRDRRRFTYLIEI